MTNKKITTPKKQSFSEIKNKESLKVIEDSELLPETTSIIPIKEFAKPLVTVEEAQRAFQQYQGLMGALMKESDIVEIQGKKKIKKTGINKIARFFGVSCEIIRTHKENNIGPQGGRNFTWYIWTKCWLPNGQSRVEGGACSSNERRFAHLEHDTLSLAITRSSKRCIENLCGMGEYEMFDEWENNTEQKPKKEETSSKELMEDENDEETNEPILKTPAPEKEPEQKIEFEEYETNGKKYFKKKVNGEIVQEGIGPDDWQPLFKSRPVKYGGGMPSSPNMEMTPKQEEVIVGALRKARLSDDQIGLLEFNLNNRADGNPRMKTILDFDRADAWDVIEAIKRKKIKIIKKGEKLTAIIEK